MVIDPARFRPEPKYTALEVAEGAGLAIDFARRVIRALGLPIAPDDAIEYDERDLEVAKTLRFLLDSGYAEEDILTISRTYGYSLSRLAFAEVRVFKKTFVDPLRAGDATEEELARRLDAVVPQMLDLLDTQMMTLHRKHLAIALQQVSGSSPQDASTETLAAGFVDLVGFTRLSNDLEADDLEDLVSRFETLALDRCVEAGAEVVKVIGDAVMFVATPGVAIRAAMSIVEGAERDPDLPDARAGLDHGPIQPLGGDFFGRPVNVAARLTSFARPGTVVISEGLLNELGPDVDASSIGRTRLKGVGTIRPFKVNAVGGDPPKGVGTRGVPQDDVGRETPEPDRPKGAPMASKDKGGKSEKKPAKKNLKEKRAQKKEKKSK
ncbi:MAG TPA: adenylate cyclase regulatory domain-containing protein [Actinomycetota bacterium]|nr:adenylate cyclase regulatory domain-containing protein [Actinomycetota bacterium]